MSITLRMTHGRLTDGHAADGHLHAADGHPNDARLFVVRLQQVLSRVFLSGRAGVGEQRLLLRGVGIEEV